jgi:hypothetical protein
MVNFDFFWSKLKTPLSELVSRMTMAWIFWRKGFLNVKVLLVARCTWDTTDTFRGSVGWRPIPFAK